MPLIAVANAKGGQGKTIWACTLAGYLNAELLDCDPQQGDAYAWAQSANHPARLIWEQGHELVSEFQKAADDKHWHVADILPHEGGVMRGALATSTALLVPVMIGAQDARGWGRMASLIKEARSVNPSLKVGVIANGVRHGTDMSKNFLPLFQEIHQPKSSVWFLGHTGLRTSIGEAYARGEQIWSINGPAGDEIRSVLEQFAKHVLKVKTQKHENK